MTLRALLLLTLLSLWTPAHADDRLTVMSWNVKHLGRKLFDPRQASPLLAGADIVTFQEVNVSQSGWRALRAVAQHLEELVGERLCMGLSEVPSGQVSERYAYLWRSSRVAYVKSDGSVLSDCPSSAVTVKLNNDEAESILREPAYGIFYFKPARKIFALASVHLVPAAKQPETEVGPVFKSFAKTGLPLIVAGDYNLDSSHPSFAEARTLGFVPVLNGVKTSLASKKRELSKPYDNFWYRGLNLVGTPQVINLYDVFTEKDHREVYQNLSDHCPIRAQFLF